jgi:hypothetical protein
MWQKLPKVKDLQLSRIASLETPLNDAKHSMLGVKAPTTARLAATSRLGKVELVAGREGPTGINLHPARATSENESGCLGPGGARGKPCKYSALETQPAIRGEARTS